MFGIGTGEILLILAIAMLVVGPEKMVEFAGKAGRLLAKLRLEGNKITSEFREALSVDEISQELQGIVREVKGEEAPAPRETAAAPTSPPEPSQPPPAGQPAPAAPEPALTRPNLSAEAEAVDLGTGLLVPADEKVEPTIIEQAQVVQEAATERGSDDDAAPARPADEG